MLTDDELARFKRTLDEAARPLIFFDNDCDGTCSFLQVWRYKREGSGHPVGHALTEEHLRKVEELAPDLVVALDIATIEQGFLDGLTTPLLWLDHHQPTKVRRGVTYLNPRVHDDADNRPTSHWVYEALGQDLWIAATGVVADWQLTSLTRAYGRERPELLNPRIQRPDRALYGSELGRLSRIITFTIKGKVSEVMRSVKILTRIEDPREVLEQSTPRGAYLYRIYEKVRREYEPLLEQALTTRARGRVLLVTYEQRRLSFTAELSNELLYRKPMKVICIAREAYGAMRLSLRVSAALHRKSGLDAIGLLNRALEGTGGRGGGHRFAVGGEVPVAAWDRFIEQLCAASRS